MYEEREWAAFIKWLQQSHYGVWLRREETPTSNPLMRHTVLSTGRWPSLRSWRITALRELCSCKFNVLILEGSVFWQETLHQSSTCERGLAVEQGAKNEPFLHHFPIKMRRHSVCLSLRITALFSTEDGSVLQCSAEQVLHLSLLCFPTRSMYPILRVAGWTDFVGVEQFLTAVEFRGHYKPKLFSSIFSFRFIPMYNRKMKYQTKLLWIHLSEVFLLFPRCEEVWNNNFSFSSLENQALCYWGADPWQEHGVLTAASAWNAVLKEMRSNSGIPTAGFPLNPKSTTQKSKVKAVGKKEPQTKMHWILNLLS